MSEISTNEPALSSALRVLERLIDEVKARGIRQDQIVLLGFSQGACLTAEFAVRNAGRYGGIIVYSGGLIGAPGTTWIHPAAFDGTPVFLGCSDTDAHVPKARIEESDDVFSRMGARVTTRIYPAMGHVINDDEIRAAQTLMDRVLA